VGYEKVKKRQLISVLFFGRYPSGRAFCYIFFAKKKQKRMSLQISEAIHEIHLKINYGIE